MRWRRFLTYRRFSLSLINFRGLCTVEWAEEMSVKQEKIAFSFLFGWPPIPVPSRYFRPNSIDDDVNTLLLSFVLSSLLLVLISHHMVTCPPLRPPD